jgi:nicotinate-nucleotide adenylyltransferase
MLVRHPTSLHTFSAHPPSAAPGQTIGLLGGSFNPAHDAHRLISSIARRQLGLDRVWWLVTPGNPLKARAELAPLAQRLEQARELANTPWIDVTAFESGLGSPFTVDTLIFLQARRPGVRFVWLMGADNLAQFHRWQRWREIFARMPVAVVDRPGWHFAALASKAAQTFADARLPASDARRLAQMSAPAWTLLTGPLSPLSSTALRKSRADAKAKPQP